MVITMKFSRGKFVFESHFFSHVTDLCFSFFKNKRDNNDITYTTRYLILSQVHSLMSHPPGQRYFDDKAKAIVIDQTHLIPALQGHYGVMAKQNLEPGSVIGLYEGFTYTFRKGESTRAGVDPDGRYTLSLDIMLNNEKMDLTISAVRPWCNGLTERINDFCVDVTKSRHEQPNCDSTWNCDWMVIGVCSSSFFSFIYFFMKFV